MTIRTNQSHGSIVKSSFTAPRWARNRHIQTIWPRFMQRRLPLKYIMERIKLDDGDFLDLAQVIHGTKLSDFPPEHDLAVQKAVLQASELI